MSSGNSELVSVPINDHGALKVFTLVYSRPVVALSPSGVFQIEQWIWSALINLFIGIVFVIYIYYMTG